MSDEVLEVQVKAKRVTADQVRLTFSKGRAQQQVAVRVKDPDGSTVHFRVVTLRQDGKAVDVVAATAAQTVTVQEID